MAGAINDPSALASSTQGTRNAATNAPGIPATTEAKSSGVIKSPTIRGRSKPSKEPIWTPDIDELIAFLTDLPRKLLVFVVSLLVNVKSIFERTVNGLVANNGAWSVKYNNAQDKVQRVGRKGKAKLENLVVKPVKDGKRLEAKEQSSESRNRKGDDESSPTYEIPSTCDSKTEKKKRKRKPKKKGGKMGHDKTAGNIEGTEEEGKLQQIQSSQTIGSSDFVEGEHNEEVEYSSDESLQDGTEENRREDTPVAESHVLEAGNHDEREWTVATSKTSRKRSKKHTFNAIPTPDTNPACVAEQGNYLEHLEHVEEDQSSNQGSKLSLEGSPSSEELDVHKDFRFIQEEMEPSARTSEPSGHAEMSPEQEVEYTQESPGHKEAHTHQDSRPFYEEPNDSAEVNDTKKVVHAQDEILFAITMEANSTAEVNDMKENVLAPDEVPLAVTMEPSGPTRISDSKKHVAAQDDAEVDGVAETKTEDNATEVVEAEAHTNSSLNNNRPWEHGPKSVFEQAWTEVTSKNKKQKIFSEAPVPATTSKKAGLSTSNLKDGVGGRFASLAESMPSTREENKSGERNLEESLADLSHIDEPVMEVEALVQSVFEEGVEWDVASLDEEPEWTTEDNEQVKEQETIAEADNVCFFTSSGEGTEAPAGPHACSQTRETSQELDRGRTSNEKSIPIATMSDDAASRVSELSPPPPAPVANEPSPPLSKAVSERSDSSAKSEGGKKDWSAFEEDEDWQPDEWYTQNAS